MVKYIAHLQQKNWLLYSWKILQAYRKMKLNMKIKEGHRRDCLT